MGNTVKPETPVPMVTYRRPTSRSMSAGSVESTASVVSASDTSAISKSESNQSDIAIFIQKLMEIGPEHAMVVNLDNEDIKLIFMSFVNHLCGQSITHLADYDNDLIYHRFKWFMETYVIDPWFYMQRCTMKNQHILYNILGKPKNPRNFIRNYKGNLSHFISMYVDTDEAPLVLAELLCANRFTYTLLVSQCFQDYSTMILNHILENSEPDKLELALYGYFNLTKGCEDKISFIHEIQGYDNKTVTSVAHKLLQLPTIQAYINLDTQGSSSD